MTTGAHARRWPITPELLAKLNGVPGAFALLGGPLVMPEHDGKRWVCLAGGCCLSSWLSFSGNNWLAVFEDQAYVERVDFCVGPVLAGAAFDFDTIIQHLGKGIQS